MLPLDVRQKLGDLNPIKTIILNEGQPLSGVDTKEAMENIRYGFHVGGN